MTVKKQPKRGGCAVILKRQKLKNSNQEIDYTTIPKSVTNYNITVGFNDRDQLQIDTKEDIKNDDSKLKDTKIIASECFKIDEINNCISGDEYPQLDNVLVFYIHKDKLEAIVIRFRNEQDYKRIYFTFKYFKMRNRLTNNEVKKAINVIKPKRIFNECDAEFNLKETVDVNGMTHLSVQSKKHEQPFGLIGIKINQDPSDKKPSKLKARPPIPPIVQNDVKNGKVLVRNNKLPEKDMKVNKTSSVIVNKDPKISARSNGGGNNLWSSNTKVQAGYDSDREEWRKGSSQFSTSAFNSLSRPARMALTLRKIPKTSQHYNYYKQAEMPPFFQQTYPSVPRNFHNDSIKERFKTLNLEYPKYGDYFKNSNLEHSGFFKSLNNDHRKFASLQNLDYLNRKKTNRFLGLTNKIKELSVNSKNKDNSTLKPVIKDSKRPVVRTCSAEPPKKVTFSAFATVQVV